MYQCVLSWCASMDHILGIWYVLENAFKNSNNIRKMQYINGIHTPHIIYI